MVPANCVTCRHITPGPDFAVLGSIQLCDDDLKHTWVKPFRPTLHLAAVVMPLAQALTYMWQLNAIPSTDSLPVLPMLVPFLRSARTT